MTSIIVKWGGIRNDETTTYKTKKKNSFYWHRLSPYIRRIRTCGTRKRFFGDSKYWRVSRFGKPSTGITIAVLSGTIHSNCNKIMLFLPLWVEVKYPKKDGATVEATANAVEEKNDGEGQDGQRETIQRDFQHHRSRWVHWRIVGQEDALVSP